MRVRSAYELPEEKRRRFERGLKLEWVSLFFLLTITIVIYLTMGSSQAMKAAWVDDALSMLPPIAILVAARYRNREPTEEYPYGFHRSIHVAFLATALILLVLGAYILYDSVHSLVIRHHPTIGTMVILGHQVWAGWVMIAALVYSIVPPLVLGRMKLSIAEEIHDKALHADATINKADWMTGGAAIVGIVGIGFGLWWADSVAAIVISADIVKDGLVNLRRVIADLIDQRPTSVEGKPLGLQDQLAEAMRGLGWVEDADARLREEGHVVAGEVYLVPAGTGSASVDQVDEAGRTAVEVDWRLHDIVVTIVRSVREDPSES